MISSRLPFESGSVIQLGVEQSGKLRVLKEWHANDLDFCFAAGDWDEASKNVVLLWRNCWHGTEMIAFDTEFGREIESRALLSGLSSAIRSRYRLPDSVTDPLGWAKTSAAAGDSFEKARARTPVE